MSSITVSYAVADTLFEPKDRQALMQAARVHKDLAAQMDTAIRLFKAGPWTPKQPRFCGAGFATCAPRRWTAFGMALNGQRTGERVSLRQRRPRTTRPLTVQPQQRWRIVR